MNDESLHSKFEELRIRAEELLRERKDEEKPAQSSGVDILSLIHELEVRQIELQIQNEELRQARRDTSAAWKAYSDLFEFAPVGYITIGRTGLISRVNRTASDILDTPKDSLKGRAFSGFVHPLDHESYYVLTQEGKEGEKSCEIRLLRAKIVPFYAQVDVLPIRDAGGRSNGWRITFMDISVRREAEEEQKKYAEKLERSNRELQEFAFIASHDLQEPLRKIQSFSNMVVQQASHLLDETSSDYLMRIQGAAARMQELLRALLKYSRVATETKPFSECNLTEAVQDVISDLDLLIHRTRGKVEVSDLPVIQADTTQIRQLFQNVIGNGLKFHRDGASPIVKIYVVPGDSHTCSIAVEDNGIGFEEEFAMKIFEPFQRLHGRSSKYEGTGMGLAICRKIIRRHGGDIKAKSSPGKGSVFIINLPYRQNETA